MKDIGVGDDNDDNAKNDEDGKQSAAQSNQNINPHCMSIKVFQLSTQLPHHKTSDTATLSKQRVKPKVKEEWLWSLGDQLFRPAIRQSSVGVT